MDGSPPINLSSRFAVRLGQRLPTPLKVLYWIVLTLTLVYWLVRLSSWLFEAIRKVGEFVFTKNNYYVLLLALFIVLLGGLLFAQFYFDLDPIGKFIQWLQSLFEV
ncbi:MAG: hypothetical protein AB7E61_06385 [Acholeplasmataceae bacterium]